jgi:tetrahydromethanopterin S-methyltransferase subunit G
MNVNRISKSLDELRDRYEASTSLVAAFIGSVMGTFIALAIVVIVGMFIGRSFAWVTIALGVIVSIASLDTVIEMLFAVFAYRRSAVGLSARVAASIFASKTVELVFFVVAALVLFHVLKLH